MIPKVMASNICVLAQVLVRNPNDMSRELPNDIEIRHELIQKLVEQRSQVFGLFSALTRIALR
jgi:hypothetical protein